MTTTEYQTRITTEGVTRDRLKQPDHNRHLIVYEFAGPTEGVFIAVSKYLEAAHCTPMYEHMLPRITKVEISGFKACVRTCESMYAGD